MFTSRIRKNLACFLIIAIMTAMLPVGPLDIWSSSALDVGTDGDGAQVVTDMKFSKQHSGYNVASGYMTIFGTNLEGVGVLFEFPGDGFKSAGTLSGDSNDSFLKYTFTDIEARDFLGRIRVGNQTIDLGISNFPNINSADKVVVNQDLGEAIIFSGNFFTRIGTNPGDVSATYGRGFSTNAITSPGSDNSLPLTPTAPAGLGYQDITISETNAPSSVNAEVEYFYNDVFRIVETLAFGNPKLFPNAAARGDFISFTADNLNDSKDYEVYFLAPTDGDSGYTAENKSPSVTLSGDKTTLSIQVPTSTNIALGTKTVKIVDRLNSEIVAEFVVPDSFSLIDASFKPTITLVNPDHGPDTGSNVQIKGKSILSLSLPDITGYNGISSATYTNGDKLMNVVYDDTNLKYQGVDVTSATRSIKVQIGKEAFFERSGGLPKYSAGTDDFIYTITDSINDADINPFKDVVVEINTIIVTAGTTYNFTQAVTLSDGYEFVPSSLEPSVDSVAPEQIHVTAGTYNIKENMLFAIKGDNFMVNKWTDGSGVVHVNYPIVTFQDQTTLGDGNFILMFDKNGDPGSLDGRIFYNDSYLNILDDGGGTPIKVDMVVLDANNKVVDGTQGNEVGTKILMYLPKEASVNSGGSRHIQVINPQRDSDDLGTGYVAPDIVNFVVATDLPVIESVVPNIITVEGSDEIVVSGTNFQEGLRLYLAGDEITTFTREIDLQGNKILLKFIAPPGIAGQTQLQIVNPGGGLAVADFYYVQSFNQDPTITSVNPNSGTANTLVVIEGDNFFKPDPTAPTKVGIDGYRLIGSKAILDGEDVNSYNTDSFGNIDFVNYTAPSAEVLFTADVPNNRVNTSAFYNNTVFENTVTSEVYTLGFDTGNNPIFFNGSEVIYSLGISGGVIHGFDSGGNDLGAATVLAGSVVFGAITISTVMDNNILAIAKQTDETNDVRIADYWYKVILEDVGNGDFYTLEKRLDGQIRLSNGQLNVYTINMDLAQTGFSAKKDGGGTHVVTVTSTTITVEGITLTIKTPYEMDPTTREIIGSRVQVISKNQMIVKIPALVSGQGFKDIGVENPDTKRAIINDGFYYFTNPASSPTISEIIPNTGSVDGGYLITIVGGQFEPTSKVYIDGIGVATVDISVNLTGTQITAKVPAYTKSLSDFGTDRVSVPVVVLNQDGGTAQVEDGFTYVNPASNPRIDELIINSGSTNGGEVVEIIGYDFRYYEPYNDTTGGGYDVGDDYTNLNGHLPVTQVWDDISTLYTKEGVDLREPTTFTGSDQNVYYNDYYDSDILPKVYFGTERARIVDYSTGYIKVISPNSSAGSVNVYIVNNDSGISNNFSYTYQSSNPTITMMNPSQGARIGQETRDIYGERFAVNSYPGYENDNSGTIVTNMVDVEGVVRFADIENRSISVGQLNDGRINSERSTVRLDGNLTVEYRGDIDAINVSVEENGKIYTRSFTFPDSQTDKATFIPVGMLMDSGGEYYIPSGYEDADGLTYDTSTHYELVMVEVDSVDKRFYVERGYAPKVIFDNSTHLIVDTPSYYTVGQVRVNVTNPDGGVASTNFTYTNPDSKPTINLINKGVQVPNENAYMVEASVAGGALIEIKGTDFREGVKVYIGSKLMEVVDITFDEVLALEVIIAKVPAGATIDVDLKFPIIIENPDGGIANSTDPDYLTSVDKWPIFFVYRTPLSGPVISYVTPDETSQFGGNTVTITGTDFRENATVRIGSKGGVPVTPDIIENRGRYIVITVPSDLTVGSKDVQVINDDFGTATLAGGLTIISYPVVDNIKAENAIDEVEWVSVEGGTKIRINGTGFDSGAKVYFGGTRTEVIKDLVGSVYGLFHNDKYINISDAIISAGVEFIDSTSLVVTIPEVFKETEYTITVINGDTGISDNNETITFSVPVPAAPVNLEVDIVAEKYIRLYDYTSNNFDYFEIYSYIGDESRSSLENNNYDDFILIDTTTLEPYKITKLPGIEDMDNDDYVNFVIKAVNKYGPSDWSNIARLDDRDVDDLDGELGSEDFDGNLDVPEGQDFVLDTIGLSAIATLSKENKNNLLLVNLNDPKYDHINTFEVNVPENIVKSSSARLYIENPIANLQLKAFNLYTNEYLNATNSGTGETYANIKIETTNNEYSGRILRYIPRGKRVLGDVEAVSINAINNTRKTALTNINGAMLMGIKYNPSLLSTTPISSLRVYRFDPQTANWVPFYDSWVDQNTGRVYANVNKPGHYVVLGNR